MTTPDHPLDRPVWSALTTGQAALAIGDHRAMRFDPDYGLFAAAADASSSSQAALAALVPDEGALALVETEAPPTMPGVAIELLAAWQMTAQRLTPAAACGFTITALDEADAPQMLDLATLTKPGPFFRYTHRLGDFIGVKDEAGRLVAMAGERMKPAGFTEVSGVCTHPDFRGRGYAGGLMRVVAAGILARGETPFLHVYASNNGAIALYESLGFNLRRPMTIAVLARG